MVAAAAATGSGSMGATGGDELRLAVRRRAPGRRRRPRTAAVRQRATGRRRRRRRWDATDGDDDGMRRAPGRRAATGSGSTVRAPGRRQGRRRSAAGNSVGGA